MFYYTTTAGNDLNVMTVDCYGIIMIHSSIIAQFGKVTTYRGKQPVCKGHPYRTIYNVYQ